MRFELIAYNPYRILGVYAGSSLTKEADGKSRIAAYAKVGQCAQFKLKGDDTLPEISRTPEMAEKAAGTLALPKDRIDNALLWFSNSQQQWGRHLDDAIEALLEYDLTKAINNYSQIVYFADLRDKFLESVTFGLMQMDEDTFADVVIEQLVKLCPNFWEYMHGPINDCGKKLILRLSKECILSESAFSETLAQSFKAINEVNFVLRFDQMKTVIAEMSNTLNVFKLAMNDDEYQRIAANMAFELYWKSKEIIDIVKDWVTAYDRHFMSIRKCISFLHEVRTYSNETVSGLNCDSHLELYENVREYYEDLTCQYEKEFKDRLKKKYKKSIILFTRKAVIAAILIMALTS